MNKSTVSKASNASSKMLQQLAARSQSRIYRAEGTFNDEEMRIIWNALGLYINRNLRMGRGVNVPKLGIFTFTPPQVRLKGVTNESQRDHRPRTPVFLIQKQFLKGVSLKSSIFYHQQFGMGLRPYTAIGSTGDVPITKMNLIEVASYANMSKDETQIALNRIIKYLGQKILNGTNISIQIPNVGNLLSRGNLVAVKFNQFLNRDTRTILSKSLDQRKQKGVMNLTSDNLKKLNKFTDMSNKLSNKSNQFFEIDDGAKKYLNQTLGLHFESNQMKRSTTGLDRSFASRQFDKTNASLKNSHFMRISATGFLTSKIKSFNRQYNFALKLVREWVHNHCESTQKSFRQFCNLVGPTKQVLKEEDVWTACQLISSDITQQQSQQLFRLLDFNKDGFVTQDDWNKNINFDSNKLFKSFVTSIQKKNWKVSKILKQMNLQGVKSVQIYKLKQGILKISPQTSDDSALHLSRYMCKGKNQITIQQFLDILNLTNLRGQTQNIVAVGNQWQQKFIGRIKRKMQENNIFLQELLNKFKFYDGIGSGYVDQSDFKSVLSEIGIGITLSQLIKIVKVIPISSQNKIDYNYLVNKLQQVTYDQTTDNKKNISEGQFLKIMNEKFFSKTPLPVKIPIIVQKLVSYLQSTLFKDYSQESLLKYVKKIDVNQDSQISAQDLKAFLVKVNQKPVKKLQSKLIESLFAKLKEKTIKKKVSLHDVFKALDTNSNGFISKQQWLKNINQFLDFNQQEKQNLFDFMDKKKLSIIDYQCFLDAMNGSNKQGLSQIFDWAETVLQKAKAWYDNSKLNLQDSYRIVDKDGDSYINDKDLINFIKTHLKVHDRQISSVRIQKLIKVLDTYKKGKLNFIDWKHFLQKKNSNWIQEAKHQIGIVLSRLYPNLQQAYTDITQGDRKLLFTSFQKWVKSNKVLSGFMINDDILKTLYSNIDTHKKGYLLQNDFISTFSSYHWKVQHEKQFFQELKLKFKSSQQAFKCLVSYEKNSQLNLNRFQNGVKQIFGKRFARSDIQSIWVKVSSGKDSMSLNQFHNKYGGEWISHSNPIDKQYPKDGWLYRDFNIIKGTTVRKEQFSYSQNDKMEEQCKKIVDNIKDMLITSAKTLQQAFQQVDSQKKGKITNLQFKKAFRVLNIALTSKQIDLLLNYCDFKLQGLINWRQFLKRINLREQKVIIFKRLLPKIQHLSDLFHYYMVSPKDAFRKWNNPRSGYLNFQEFYKMLKNLYEQASETMPQFQMLKQLFQFIDVRKDEVLDFQEFTQIFRNCKPPSLLMGTTPATETQLKSKFIIQDHQNQRQIREQSIPLFKNSQNYEKLVNLIGRNRKYLQTQIQKSGGKNDPLVPFSTVQRVIGHLTKSHKLNVEDNLIRNVIAFSMTGQKVDYKLLFSNFKQRNQQILQFPKQNVF